MEHSGFRPEYFARQLISHDKYAGLSLYCKISKTDFWQLLSLERTEAALTGALLVLFMLLSMLNLKDRAARSD
jgi:hypothetical protein